MKTIAVILFGVLVVSGTAWAWVDFEQRTTGATDYAPSSVAPASDEPADPALPRNPKVAILGDSLAAGWFATEEEDGWRPRLMAAVRQARPGARLVGDWKAGIATAGAQEAFALPQRSDLVIVELGTNDVTKDTPRDAFGSNYADYLGQLREANPDARLLCLGSFVDETTQSDAVDETIQETCAAEQGTFVSLDGVFAASGARGPAGRETWLGPADLGHPNDLGHSMIANLIWTRLTQS